MTWLIIAVLVLVALVISVGAWAYRTANRLDRLHVRYDLSWQALDGALARRAVVTRAVAIDAYGGALAGRRLAALADAAEGAPRHARENAENELSAALAMVDPTSLPAGLVAELAREAGFPAGVINIVNGPGETAGDALVKHPGVDKIAFTGATTTLRSLHARPSLQQPLSCRGQRARRRNRRCFRPLKARQ